MPPKPHNKSLKRKRKRSDSDRTLSASNSSSGHDSRPGSAMSTDSDGPDTHSSPVRDSRSSSMDLSDDDGPSAGTSSQAGTSFRAGASPRKAWSDDSDDSDDDSRSDVSASIGTIGTKRLRFAVPADPRAQKVNAPPSPPPTGAHATGSTPPLPSTSAAAPSTPPPVAGPSTTVTAPGGPVPSTSTAPAPTAPYDRDKFTRAANPLAKRVDLYPGVLVEGGRIAGVAFGTTRTPTPFPGGRMGDHTASWASVVDSIHAELYGKTLQEAVTALLDRQKAADGWMDGGVSPAMKLWQLLGEDDRDNRHASLEGYAFRVHDELAQADALLQKAGGAPDAAATVALRGHLSEAIGHHAAYLNMLPLATVPAETDRGSTGSGEGTSRADVLAIDIAVDKARRADPGAPRPAFSSDTVNAARKGLWALFSMSAGTREARLGEALNPDRVRRTRERMEAVTEYAATMETEIRALVQLPGTGGGAGTGARQVTRMAPGKDADGVLKSLKALKAMTATGGALSQDDVDSPYGRLGQLARRLLACEAELTRLTTEPKVSAKDLRGLLDRAGLIAEWRAELAADIATLSKGEQQARDDTALMLAHMIHDHQSNVARAYPEAVRETGFLRPDPVTAAKTELQRHIDDHVKAESGEDAKLLTAFEKAYLDLHTTPAPAADSSWVTGARNTGLVVAFRGTEPVIQGRAAAPVGVSGMGSHSTAWVVESRAVKRMVAAEMGGGTDRTPVIARLGTEMRHELAGRLMGELGPLLPADQLKGGQLINIVDAALAVQRAGTAEEAIHAYLSFRNLLPFATVNAGSRDGHGERENANEKETFDGDSLTAEADLKGEAVEDDPDDALDTADAAITRLEARLNDPASGWSTDPAFDATVRKAVTAMRKKVASLRSDSTATQKTAISNLITDIRWSEHHRVFTTKK